MLLAQFLDRVGTGVWGAASVLFFTFVVGLDTRHLGLLLGAAGLAGIAGSPLAGRLAGRFAVRSLLIGCHLLRFATLSLLLLCTGFDALLPVVGATYLCDRAAKALEMVFATRVAGPRRTTYQALSRSAANAGYALGAGIAAVGLTVGSDTAYRMLIGGDAASFLLVAALVWHTREPPKSADECRGHRADLAPQRATRPNPWRDAGYLLFVLLDAPMNLDDSILNVGLPLWLVHHTMAPRILVPTFLLLNTVGVVLMQMRVSARVGRPHQAAAAVAVNGLAILLCCTVLTVATTGGRWSASVAMVTAAVLVTVAELMRSVSSWELAVSLAPRGERAAYLGVAGMSQSVQKSGGPLLLTGAVMTAGTVGWLALGAGVAALSVAQWRCCRRRLQRHQARRDANRVTVEARGAG